MIEDVTARSSSFASMSARTMSGRDSSTLLPIRVTWLPLIIDGWSTLTAEVSLDPKSDPITPMLNSTTPRWASIEVIFCRRLNPNATTPTSSAIPTGTSSVPRVLPSTEPIGVLVPSHIAASAPDPITIRVHAAPRDVICAPRRRGVWLMARLGGTFHPARLVGESGSVDLIGAVVVAASISEVGSVVVPRRGRSADKAVTAAAIANSGAIPPPDANAWTELGRPERVTAIPASTAAAAIRRQRIAVVRRRACSDAINAIRGASAVFSTGSQAHQPPQPSSSWAHHEPSRVAESSMAAASAVQRRATSGSLRRQTRAAPRTIAWAEYSSGGWMTIAQCSRTGFNPTPLTAGSASRSNGWEMKITARLVAMMARPTIRRRTSHDASNSGVGSVCVGSPYVGAPSVGAPSVGSDLGVEPAGERPTATAPTVTTRADQKRIEPEDPAQTPATRRGHESSSLLSVATSTRRRSTEINRQARRPTAAQNPLRPTINAVLDRGRSTSADPAKVAATSAATPSQSIAELYPCPSDQVTCGDCDSRMVIRVKHVEEDSAHWAVVAEHGCHGSGPVTGLSWSGSEPHERG